MEWLAFWLLVGALLAVDLLFGKTRSARTAWLWSAAWIGAALAFGAWIGLQRGSEAALTYVTAYLLEKSLSLDNLVLFSLVFAQTGIAPPLQHRALMWGVLGALVMRAALIGAGIYALERFHWLVYPFAALLLYAALRMLKGEEPQRRIAEATCGLCSSWISRFIPIVRDTRERRFIVRVDGRRHATPLLVALVAVESADLVFAVDSIPAIFAVTTDPFLVYSSNVFALLGLRSLYMVLGDLVSRFRYLRVGLAVLLFFVALKLALSGVVHVPPGVSLAVIAAILAAAIAASRFLPAAGCRHRDQIRVLEPSTKACEQCLALGERWVSLRMCMSCGHVGCCDSSRNKHASAHFRASGHPIIRSIEPGERWRWCYVDEKAVD